MSKSTAKSTAKMTSSMEATRSEESDHQISLIYAAPDSDLPSEFGDDDALLSYVSMDEGRRNASKAEAVKMSLLEPDKPSELRSADHPSPSLILNARIQRPS